MQKILDPHVHFFDLNKGDYAWLRKGSPPFWSDKHIISKNFFPDELGTNQNFELVGAVHIEAGFNNKNPKKELRWLEAEVYTIAPKLVFKSIGFADITLPNSVFIKLINSLLFCPTFKGIRYIIGEDDLFIAKFNDILKNIKCLENAAILLEIQFEFTNELLARSLLKLIKSSPLLRVVINHAGMPPLPLETNEYLAEKHSLTSKTKAVNKANKWEQTLAEFAALPNCYIKCSGFEMHNRHYTQKDVADVISLVHANFGTLRTMLASNFPLTLFSIDYASYWQLLYDCAINAHLDCEHLMYLNAKKLYGF